MAIEASELITALLGGGLASSVLTPMIAQRTQHRDLRAAILRAIAVVERTRWAPSDPDEFRQAIVTCHAAALVAGVNRELTDRYLFYAEVSRGASEWSADMAPTEEGGGAIPTQLADLVRDAGAALVDHAWRPLRTRPRMGTTLARLDERERTVKEDADGREGVVWNRRRIV